MIEEAKYKTGLMGIRQDDDKMVLTKMSLRNKAQMLWYFAKNYAKNPAYINESLWDTWNAFWQTFVVTDDFLYLYHYLPWHEDTIVGTIRREYDWEVATDTTTTWRIGDGTAAFYNYVYGTIAGFTEDEAMLSNMVREGHITRDEALRRGREHSKPRWPSIRGTRSSSASPPRRRCRSSTRCPSSTEGAGVDERPGVGGAAQPGAGPAAAAAAPAWRGAGSADAARPRVEPGPGRPARRRRARAEAAHRPPRLVGQVALGVFNLVTISWFAFAVLGAGGLQFAVLRAVAEDPDDRDRLAAVVAGALIPAVGLAAAATGLYVLLRVPFGALQGPAVAEGMLWAAPGLFCFALNKVLFGVVNGLRRMRAFAVYTSLRYVLIAVGLLLARVPGSVRRAAPPRSGPSPRAGSCSCSWASSSPPSASRAAPAGPRGPAATSGSARAA